MLLFGHMSKNNIPSKIQRENSRRLIDAAFAVFTRDGYDKASIRSVAKQADMTPGLVYYYFKTKDELLIAVQSNIQERYRELYKSSDHKAADIKEQLDEIRSRVIDNPDWYRWRYELYALGLKREDLKQEVAEVLRKGRESLVESLYPTIMSDKNSATAISSLLIACFDGLALQKLIDNQFNLDIAYDELLAILKQYFTEHDMERKS